MLKRKRVPRVLPSGEDLQRKYKIFNKIFAAAREQNEVVLRYAPHQTAEALKAYRALKNYQVKIRRNRLKEPESYFLVEGCVVSQRDGLHNIVIRYDPDHKKRAFESVISIINASEQLKHIEVKPESERTHYDFLSELLETV